MRTRLMRRALPRPVVNGSAAPRKNMRWKKLNLERSAMTQKAIGFVGFGEAAQCFATDLAAKGVPEPLVFCEGPTNIHPTRKRFAP
jgi:hypothetical protein